ncbi:MAG: LLM class flavin-dependent oxidoreductase, partial [Myxococcales bacterium]|nr:LLM class flavin-dependent oxidoreductase [Myxococcales bacterium]
MKIAYMPDTHFGVYDQPTPTSEEAADATEHLLKECELAERVGFDGLWFPERHARAETFFSSTEALMAAAAVRTSRVDLVPTVIQPTFHHPVHLAEQLAAVDLLSRGRLIFGAGVGYHEDYFRLFGVPSSAKGRRFEEVMEVIRGVWEEERFSFKGEFFEFDDVYLTPKPFQRPRPPIWIG